MTPAPDTDRTAACAHCKRPLTAEEQEYYGTSCERCETELHHAMQDDRAPVLPPPSLTIPEMLESVARFLWHFRYSALPDATWDDAIAIAKDIPDGKAAATVENFRAKAGLLLSGPLAPVLAEIAQLRSRLLQAEKGGEISGRGPSGPGSHPTGEAAQASSSLRDVDPSRIARLEPRVHVHIWASATELTGEQKAQPEWLWLAADDYLSFGRYQKKGTQAPYVRADIAVALALGIDARRVETLGSTCESPTPQGGMPEAVAAKAAPLPETRSENTGGRS